MVLFFEMFVSELIGIPVVDRLQEPIGKIKDIVFITGEVFPRITALLVQIENKEEVILMSEIDLIGRQFVVTRSTRDRLVFTHLRHEELLLQRNLLDMQIVDTEGARVIRINDLKLAKVDQEIRLIAADVGLRGLTRRLGILKPLDLIAGWFGKKVPETLIGWDHVESLKTGRSRGMVTIPARRISEMHPADIANIISQVHSEEKTALFASLSEKAAAESLHELEPRIQALLLTTVDTKKALGILNKMPVDEVVDVLGDLPNEKREELLRLMHPKKATEARALLPHHDETAGGLMTTEFMTVPSSLTVKHTIEKMRAMAPSVETIYYLYVVDEKGKLVGAISLRNLIIALPETPIDKIMVKDLIVVTPETNQRKTAEIISKYNLLAVPVVDKAGKILGIVTVDDVIDFILPPMPRRKKAVVG